MSLATKTTFAGCEVVSVRIDEIRPYDKNPRKIVSYLQGGKPQVEIGSLNEKTLDSMKLRNGNA